VNLALPFQPPIEPMLAKLSTGIPEGDGWLFEPKWDGFRALVFKSGDDVYIQSRDLKPLGRYFPELEVTLRANLPDRCVLDGEVVIAHDGKLDFEAMLLRIHSAASRVKLLAAEPPSSYVAWDLLALGDEDLRDRPQAERRARLEQALAGVKPPVHITPMTRDRAVAADWFQRFEGAGLDGVMAKPESLTYTPRQARDVQDQARAHRRLRRRRVPLVQERQGPPRRLAPARALRRRRHAPPRRHHLRVQTRGARAARRDAQADARGRAREPPVEGLGRLPGDRIAAAPPGATSRWNRGKDLSWEPIKIGLVCEVGYDHLQGTRFRHATHFKRWRPDKPPSECRYDQLEVTPAFELQQIFGR
jgi:ATP-dependent DNA ligase